MTIPAPIGSSRPNVPALREGELLGGRYRIESTIQTRPSGVVYAATDLTRGARVSAHVFVAPGAVAARESARMAFLAGARRAKALSSASVARTLDVGVTKDSQPWVVREHLGSETLEAQLRKKGALSTADAIDVGLAVCDAIAEAHAHGILHLGLGAHAVHVAWSASGLSEVKVTGLGTSSVEAKLALGATRDAEGVLRAPEQLRGTDVDVRADVWAIGVLLHTMVAGAPPFGMDTPSGASLAVVLDDPPSLAGVPDELAEIVERALARDPAQRPATVIDLAESLVAFASSPERARERLAKRRGLELIPESEPTLVVSDYAELILEQGKKRTAKDLPDLVDVETPIESEDIIVEVAPSARELVQSEPPPPVLVQSEPPPPVLLPTIAEVQMARAREGSGAFWRGGTIKIVGSLAAAACDPALETSAPEATRLSASRGESPVTANAAAAPAPEEPAAAPLAPPPEVSANAPAVLRPTDLPAAHAPAEAKHAAAGAAASASPRLPTAAPATAAAAPVSVQKPAAAPPSSPSHPSPSGSADDLRRFLDDRR